MMPGRVTDRERARKRRRKGDLPYTVVIRISNKEIAGNKCISYFTIELKEALIPSEKKWNDWIFGCDICQDVCPWNRFSKTTTEEHFKPINEILNYTTSDWEEITEETFKKVFKDSPLSRTKFSGIKRNLKFVQ